MTKPSSFCSLATDKCKKELLGLLLSLSCHHPAASIICLCDDITRSFVEKYAKSHPINLNIMWDESLNLYKGKNRTQMEKDNSWTEFQMMKTKVIDKALELYPDTLLLDSDIIICNTIDCIDTSKDLGVSPHFIKKSDTDKFGYYNGGVLWTKNKSVPAAWRNATKNSRYYDQASIEDLARMYSHFEFGPNYNMSWWRLQQGDEPIAKIKSYFNINESQKITFKGQPLGFIHTHFNRKEEEYFNSFIINLFRMAHPTYSRELGIIIRISRE